MDSDIKFNRFPYAVRYALRGTTYLAENYGEHYCQIQNIAAAEKLPADFLSKIFQKLAHRGILLSRRGIRGGYRLAEPPDRIALAQIVEATGGATSGRSCFLEIRDCGSKTHCMIHDNVVRSENILIKTLQRTSLGDLVKNVKKGARLKLQKCAPS